ncbi:MAG: HD domain-containing protein [Candidatus Omnitrophica bacterium]|nr:HD domain-containing protein [Candidatus Omnitrophota bacterium]
MKIGVLSDAHDNLPKVERQDIQDIMKLPASSKKLLKIVLVSAQKKKLKVYLVGGILRDFFLKRDKDNPDIDFCLKKGAINFARELSRKTKSGFVVLDKEHGAARLVKRIKDKVYTLDFTDFRGKTLEEDLARRDFTINAIVLELEKAFGSGDFTRSLIDPCSGRKDLKNKLIRAAGGKAFDEDPLRILRAFSFACIFGFKIDKQTLKLIKLKKKKLSGVSCERIRDELFKILDAPCAFDYLAALDKLKILKLIFPEIEMMRGVSQGPYHHLDVWEHTLETIRQLEIVIKELKNDRQAQDYLNQVVSSERKRRSLLKLAAFLHDIGKPRARRRREGKLIFHGHERMALGIVEDICRRLRLSNDELSALKRIVFCHLRPGYLADNEIITRRAKFRFFRDTANEAASVLLMAIADQRATRGPLTTKAGHEQHERVVWGLIREYFRKAKEKRPARLLTGDDLIRKFKLEPSPLIGKILREVEELQAIGRIKTRQEAFKIAEKLIFLSQKSPFDCAQGRQVKSHKSKAKDKKENYYVGH